MEEAIPPEHRPVTRADLDEALGEVGILLAEVAFAAGCTLRVEAALARRAARNEFITTAAHCLMAQLMALRQMARPGGTPN